VEHLFRRGIGVVAEPNAESLGEAIIRLAQNPQQAKAFEREARSLAEGELNWSALAEKLESFYSNLAGTIEAQLGVIQA